MPPVNPLPRNLRQLIEAGAAEEASALMDRGYFGQRLQRKLKALFPEALGRSITALRGRVVDERAAARGIRSMERVTPVRLAELPTVEGLAEGGSLTYKITIQGPGARAPGYVFVELENVAGKTPDELQAMAREAARRGEWKYGERRGRTGISDQSILNIELAVAGRG